PQSRRGLRRRRRLHVQTPGPKGDRELLIGAGLRQQLHHPFLVRLIVRPLTWAAHLEQRRQQLPVTPRRLLLAGDDIGQRRRLLPHLVRCRGGASEFLRLPRRRQRLAEAAPVQQRRRLRLLQQKPSLGHGLTHRDVRRLPLPLFFQGLGPPLLLPQ